jgi:bifunctional UDP-N-acetylglucosamine pyrophosphorylase / glucosamine-1-phosphate N-acetyltransferase|tara:strand:- start:1118 stop:1882 length:765 start_codon:yes stop_codon:yes gene_type:complete
MRNLTVLVLAGGLGKRMKSTIPKVLHKINDKSILSNILIKVNKLENVFIKVVVGKYHQLIKETLKDEIPNIESNLEYIFQEYSLGTGHALLCSIPNLRTLNGNILILNGDAPLITISTLTNMINTFNQNSIYSGLIASITPDSPKGYGRLYCHDDTVLKIVEEKDCTEEQREIKNVNAGIYLFDNNTLMKYLNKLNNKNAQKEYYLTDMIEILGNYQHKILKYHIENPNELININNPEQLDIAKQLLKKFKELK